MAGFKFSLKNGRTIRLASQNSRKRGLPSCEIELRINCSPWAIFSSGVGREASFSVNSLKRGLSSRGSRGEVSWGSMSEGTGESGEEIIFNSLEKK
jgi:hypothetical protein